MASAGAIVVERHGGPEVLEWKQVEVADPGEGELTVGVAAAGVNFIDTYQRSGLYPLDLPFTPGLEGAGFVEKVGPGVVGHSVGDRVAWTGSLGSYAEVRTIPADKAVLVPERVDLDHAAALLLQGITAHYLVNDTYRLQEGERCLIHAGAGGVGTLLIQLAKRAGAEVFTTVSTEEKAEIAASAGADHVINYVLEDFAKAIEASAGERPLHVIYDGVGATTFEAGLALLRPRGMMVTFGNASGPPPDVSPLDLMRRGSLYVTRPTMFDYISEHGEMARRVDELFQLVGNGELTVRIGERFPLASASAAHRALEGRLTTGKVLLEP